MLVEMAAEALVVPVPVATEPPASDVPLGLITVTELLACDPTLLSSIGTATATAAEVDVRCEVAAAVREDLAVIVVDSSAGPRALRRRG